MAKKEKTNLFTWTDSKNRKYSYTLEDIEQLTYKPQYIRNFLSRMFFIADLLKTLGFNLTREEETDLYKILKKLENKKLNLNAKDASGNTPLHLAAQEGNHKLAQLLIEAKVEINAPNKDQNTPLHLAAQKGKKELVELLINNDATINAPNKDRNTPLHLALQEQHNQIGLIITDKEKNYEQTLFSQAIKQKQDEDVKSLINSGANISSKNPQGNTLLHLAIREGDTKTIEYLIKNQANINIQNNQGNTPLHLAIQKGDTNIIESLIKNQANINIQNNQGNTPLYIAITSRNNNIAKLLINQQADLNITNLAQKTPLHIIAAEGSLEILDETMRTDAQNMINAQDREGNTALHLAIANGHNNMVKVLTSLPQINTNIQNYKGDTPLYLAASKENNEDMVKLLENKVNIEQEEDKGLKLLSEALKNNYTTLAISLIDKGAQINSNSPKIFNPLHLAIKSGNEEMVKLLVNKGADLSIKCGVRHETPLEFARIGANSSILTFLEKVVSEQNTKLPKSSRHIEQKKRTNRGNPSRSI